MKKLIFIIVAILFLMPLISSASTGNYQVLGVIDYKLLISDGSDYYLLDTGFMCPASYFNQGDIISIDTGYSYNIGYGSTIFYNYWGDYRTCSVDSSEKLNFKKYYLLKESSSDEIIVEDSEGDQYLVEYGAGCSSMWRYEGKYIYIDVTGYLNGVGDTIYLLDDEQDCRVWDVEELNTSNNYSLSLNYPVYNYSCPLNSTYNNTTNNCVCNFGYVVFNNQCIDINTACFYVYGENSWGYGDGCYCDKGYTWNTNKTACILQSTNTSNLYQRPNTTVVIPSVINYYIGTRGKKIYTDRPDPMAIIGAMVKGETDPATYIVDIDGKLRWMKTEAVAARLFGERWDSYITWFNDSIIYTYKFGETIEQ